MLHLYDYLDSGNGYKVRLLLHHLKLPFAFTEVDILSGGTRTPEFLARNPNGRIPLLELDDGRHLAESNAIIFYLSEESDLLPSGRLQRAEVLQWLFFEQYNHEPNIAVARFWKKHGGIPGGDDALLREKHQKGYAALDVMETHLGNRSFFVANRFSIADIALYAYTHVAHEGGFSLTGYPAVRAWLDRIAEQPDHVPITWCPE